MQERKTPLQTLPDSGEEIDLLDLCRALLSHWHLLVLCTLIGALAVNVVTFFFIKPVYESTSKLYIVSASGDSVVDLTDLNIGTSLTNDYKELIMSYPVLNQVIQAMKLDCNDEALKQMVTVTNPANTRVLSITVKTNDPKLSMDIANTMAGVVQEYLPETMSTIRPNVAQVARMATSKSSPSYPRNTLMGALLGFAAMAGLLTLRYLMDDTLRSSDDLEALGVRVLTVVPETHELNLSDDLHQSGSKHSTRRRRHK